MSQVLTSEFPLTSYALTSADGIAILDDALELCEFMYRIREWEVVINITNSASGAFLLNGTYPIVARSQDFDGVVTGIPANEREANTLDLDPSWPGLFGGLLSYSSGSDASFDYSLFRFFEVTTVAGVQTAWRVQAILSAEQSIPATPTTELTTTAQAGYTGSAVDFQIRGHGIDLFESPGGGNWTGTITAIPVAWWPFAPTAGGPDIFDTTTGIQISPNVVSFDP